MSERIAEKRNSPANILGLVSAVLGVSSALAIVVPWLVYFWRQEDIGVMPLLGSLFGVLAVVAGFLADRRSFGFSAVRSSRVACWVGSGLGLGLAARK